MVKEEEELALYEDEVHSFAKCCNYNFTWQEIGSWSTFVKYIKIKRMLTEISP